LTRSSKSFKESDVCKEASLDIGFVGKMEVRMIHVLVGRRLTNKQKKQTKLILIAFNSRK